MQTAADKGRWGFALKVHKGVAGGLLMVDEVTDGGAFARSGASDERGSVLVAVNGVFTMGASLSDVTTKIKQATAAGVEVALCSADQLCNVSSEQLLQAAGAVRPRTAEESLELMAAEAKEEALKAWGRFQEWYNDETDQWVTAPKQVVAPPVVVPERKSQVAVGDTATRCGWAHVHAHRSCTVASLGRTGLLSERGVASASLARSQL
jgi:hypothetical protein